MKFLYSIVLFRIVESKFLHLECATKCEELNSTLHLHPFILNECHVNTINKIHY